MPSSLSRRQFLRASAATTLPMILAGRSEAQKKTAANDRIQLGFIGVGMMGRGHLGRFLSYSDVQVVAIAEIEKTRREHARQSVVKRYADRKKSGDFRGVQVTSDFRKLIAREDVDAVVIATPDHWHAIPILQAAAAKKDIYCEKPLTFRLHEGRLIAEAVKKAGVIFQTGSQQRSEFGGRFRQAVELIRNGRLGKIHTVRVGVGGPAVPCDLPEGKAPADTDWEMWVGPSEYRGYNEILCPKGIHRHFPAFRKYREYAGGSLADMGAHHFDIAQWALGMDESGPTKIEPPEGQTGLKFTYANGIVMYHGGPSGCTFEGSEGKIHVDRPKLVSDPVELTREPLSKDAKQVYRSTNHRRNWIECMRSRKQTICPPEVGHRSASICHLANIGYWLGRPLTWDPVKERFQGDDEANGWLQRKPRKPWSYSVT